MIKKFYGIIIMASMVFMTACGSKSANVAADVGAAPSVENVEGSGKEGAQDSNIAEKGESQEGNANINENTEKKDVDLTKLSGTMVYAEVYNIMVSPEEYVGRKIKMRGEFAVYPDEATKENRYAVIISDVSACCAQGLMFVLAGEPIYPDDYPEEGTEITVEGEFQNFNEEEYFYYHLVDAQILQD